MPAVQTEIYLTHLWSSSRAPSVSFAMGLLTFPMKIVIYFRIGLAKSDLSMER